MSKHVLLVAGALATTTLDWMKVPTIAARAQLSVAETEAALVELGTAVRIPFAARPDEKHLYRLACRPRTRGERVRLLRAALVRS